VTFAPGDTRRPERQRDPDDQADHPESEPPCRRHRHHRFAPSRQRRRVLHAVAVDHGTEGGVRRLGHRPPPLPPRDHLRAIGANPGAKVPRVAEAGCAGPLPRAIAPTCAAQLRTGRTRGSVQPAHVRRAARTIRIDRQLVTPDKGTAVLAAPLSTQESGPSITDEHHGCGPALSWRWVSHRGGSDTSSLQSTPTSAHWRIRRPVNDEGPPFRRPDAHPR